MHAQQAEEPSGGLEEVVVTALKTQQNLQDVPVSIQAIGTERLEELNITSFDDYVKYLPSVSLPVSRTRFARVSCAARRPATTATTPVRSPVWVSTSMSSPSPRSRARSTSTCTTSRASSAGRSAGHAVRRELAVGHHPHHHQQARQSGFEAGYSIEGNTVGDGDPGYLAEGFVNIPLGESAAIRLVGWARHDGGYIDNVAATRTFPTSGISMEFAGRRELQRSRHLWRARRAQDRPERHLEHHAPLCSRIRRRNGVYAGECEHRRTGGSTLAPGEHRRPVGAGRAHRRRQVQQLDITFASSYLKRDVNVNSDYSDYAFFYDTLVGYGTYFYDNAGELINPSQFIQGKDGYTKTSNELRFSTSAENRWRFVGGLFAQRQTHDIQQEYIITGLADDSDVTGWDDTFWLTKQWRVDRDAAMYGEVTFDATEKLSFTGGARYFQYGEFAGGILRLWRHQSV